jgi:hypothetical protein
MLIEKSLLLKEMQLNLGEKWLLLSGVS